MIITLRNNSHDRTSFRNGSVTGACVVSGPSPTSGNFDDGDTIEIQVQVDGSLAGCTNQESLVLTYAITVDAKPVVRQPEERFQIEIEGSFPRMEQGPDPRRPLRVRR